MEEASSELAAMAFVDAAGLIVDIPSKVLIEVRDADTGLAETFEIDLAPAMRRKAA